MCHFDYIHKRPVHPSTTLTVWARLINKNDITGRTFCGSNYGGGDIFHAFKTGPDSNPASCTMVTLSFQVLRRPEHDIDDLAPPSADLRMGWG